MVPDDVAAFPAGVVVVKEEVHFPVVLKHLKRMGHVPHAVEHADGFRQADLLPDCQVGEVVEESLEHEYASILVLRSLDGGDERAAADLGLRAAQGVASVVVHESYGSYLLPGIRCQAVLHLLTVVVQDLLGYAPGLRIADECLVREGLADLGDGHCRWCPLRFRTPHSANLLQ